MVDESSINRLLKKFGGAGAYITLRCDLDF